MYAIVKDGSNQYKVAEGDDVQVEKKDLAIGDSFEFDGVLMYAAEGKVRVGTPTLDDVKVVAEVKDHTLGEKIVVRKFRRRKDSRTKKGHRQKYTCLKITKIEAN